MVNSRVWGILNDIKKKYNFKFILIGDFNQLDPVESKVYNVQNSEVFAEICDGQMLELKTNWRAMHDPEFKFFILTFINHLFLINGISGFICPA